MAANVKLLCALATNKGLFMLERAGSKLNRIHYSKEITTAVAANALGEAVFGTLSGTVLKMSKSKSVHEGTVTCLSTSEGKIYSCGEIDKTLKILSSDLEILKAVKLEDYCKSIDVQGERILTVLRCGKMVDRFQDNENVLINAHFAGELWGLAYNPVHG